ncbi:MAG TPA: hypothetical protein VGL44_03120 [Gaiellales bacterium]
MSTRTKLGIWLVRRNPRTAAKLGWKAARHPRRTADLVRLGQAAPDIARRARTAASDPQVQAHLRASGDALTAARDRVRGSGDIASAVTDEKLWSELRRAAAAMAAGYAVAQAPAPKRRRRLGRLVLSVGVIGAGAYAGYRATRTPDRD